MSPRERLEQRLERERLELAEDDVGATSPEVYRTRAVKERPQPRAELVLSIEESVKRRAAAMPD